MYLILLKRFWVLVTFISYVLYGLTNFKILDIYINFDTKNYIYSYTKNRNKNRVETSYDGKSEDKMKLVQ